MQVRVTTISLVKTLTTLTLVFATIMALPTYSFAQTTEDDGYIYDSDDPEEQQEQDEREQEAWEDAERPGELDDDDENDNDDNDNDNNILPRSAESPAIANTPGLAAQSTAVNETRWYNNCVGGGKQDGGGLQFNTFSYQTCGQNADGDKGYYDGFVQGCMGIDSTNTQELCQSYVVECLRATSVDGSETCDADVDTTSSAWKLVMTHPS